MDDEFEVEDSSLDDLGSIKAVVYLGISRKISTRRNLSEQVRLSDLYEQPISVNEGQIQVSRRPFLPYLLHEKLN
jgi:hypothetical protein